MATKKAGGTAKNLRDSNPKYLGVKRSAGTFVKMSEVIVRQRGTKILAGKNVRTGKDHTLFAGTNGVVSFTTTKKKGFDGKPMVKKVAHVTAK